MKIQLIREYESGYTKGELKTPFGDFKTLELPNLNNEQHVSCIPEGIYTVRKSAYRNKHRGKPVFRFDFVKGRDGVLIHKGNFLKDIDGCILVGMKFDEKVPMVLDSTIAFDLLWKYLPQKFEVEITKEDDVTDFTFFADYKGLENDAIQLHSKKVEPKKKGKGLFISLLLGLGFLAAMRS